MSNPVEAAIEQLENAEEEQHEERRYHIRQAVQLLVGELEGYI